MNNRQESTDTAPATDQPSTPYMAGANAGADGAGNGNPHTPFTDAWHAYEAGYHDAMRLMRRGNGP